MNTTATLAQNAANTQPGPAKLIALLVAIAICVIVVQVHKRLKGVKEGTESDPFSSESATGVESAETQVSTPTEGDQTAPQKGVRKWFGKN